MSTFLSSRLDAVLAQPEMKGIRRTDFVYASSLGFMDGTGKISASCRRSVWYYMKKQHKDRPVNLLTARKALYGEYCAMGEVELAKRARVYVADEVPVVDEARRISGRIDLVVIDPEATTKPYVIVEQKSIYGFYSTKGTIKRDQDGLYTVRPKDLAQIAFYAWVYQEAISYAILRYITRDIGDARDHVVVVAPDGSIAANGRDSGYTVGQVYKWVESVTSHYDSNTLPPQDFQLVYDKETLKAKADAGEFGKTDTEKINKGWKITKGDFLCGYCDYVHACWGDCSLPRDLTVSDALHALGR